MASLIFFEQKRHDGAIRTGIVRDDDLTLLGLFFEGPSDSEDDPLGAALVWYTEIRCRGDSLPIEPEEARAWFISRDKIFRLPLLDLATKVQVGWDSPFPITWKKFEGLDKGVDAEFVCSAINGLADPSISDLIKSFATDLEAKLKRLQPLETASL